MASVGSTSEMNKLAERFIEAIGGGDLAALRELCHPEAVFWNNLSEEETSVEVRMARIAQEFEVFESFAFDDVRVRPLEDGFVQQMRGRGATRGGERFAFPLCIVATARDGRIVRVEEYVDAAPVAPILSALEALAGPPLPVAPPTEALREQMRIDRAPEREGREERARIAEELHRLGLERHAEALDRDGLTVVPPETLGAADLVPRARERVLDLIEAQSGVRPDVESGTSHANRYMPSLYYFLMEDPVFEELLMNPVALALATYLTGEDCMLNASAVFMKGPAEREPGRQLQHALHADMEGWRHPEPYPAEAQVCNTTWLLSDYTRENGALAYLPGSHLMRRAPVGREAEERAVPVEAPAGSLAVWSGHTWHGSFPRSQPGLRIALAYAFNRPHLAQQQPYQADVTKEMLERNSPRFAKLMGLHVPTGWRAEGPERMMLARRQMCDAAGSVSLYPG